MAVAVFTIHIAIVIDEIFISSIVRWIDIDEIDFPLVCVGKCRKRC